MSSSYNERFARHFNLEGFGPEAQERLSRGSVLVIGAGGLGSPVLMYLAASGVGRIGVIDPDTVSLSNMQRQVIHDTPSIGQSKTDSARRRMLGINPDITVDIHPGLLNEQNATDLFCQYDFVIDATDNPAAKYLINDACVAIGKPFSHGSINGFSGQAMTVIPGKTPCYRCLFPEPSTDVPAPRGPLGPVPGVIGCIQAIEAIKFLAGIGELLAGRMLIFDGLEMTFDTISLEQRQGCRC